MSEHNIVILASGKGTNLNALINASKNQNYKIISVYSDVFNSGALNIAKHNDIENYFINPKDFKDNNEYETELAKNILKKNPRLIVLAGFMRILHETFLHHFPMKVINLHPALLPKHKGLHTHLKAKQAGDYYHGASVHLVSTILDDGPILLRGKIKMPQGDIKIIANAVQKIEHQILPLAIQLIIAKRIEFINNNITLDKIPLSKKWLNYCF